MAMNETLRLLVLAGWRGLARRVFLRRPLVDGAQGPFVQTAGAVVLRQPAAADERALVGFYLVSGGHWERLLACLLGFVIAPFYRDAAHPAQPTQSQTVATQEASHAP
jgi:hypothetical protein